MDHSGRQSPSTPVRGGTELEVGDVEEASEDEQEDGPAIKTGVARAQHDFALESRERSGGLSGRRPGWNKRCILTYIYESDNTVLAGSLATALRPAWAIRL